MSRLLDLSAAVPAADQDSRPLASGEQLSNTYIYIYIYISIYIYLDNQIGPNAQVGAEWAELRRV